MMKEKINHFLNLFPKITKEDCDAIEIILKWDDEKKAAFLLAKQIFENDLEDENVQKKHSG